MQGNAPARNQLLRQQSSRLAVQGNLCDQLAGQKSSQSVSGESRPSLCRQQAKLKLTSSNSFFDETSSQGCSNQHGEEAISATKGVRGLVGRLGFLFVSVTMITVAELMLDLVTTIISFVSLLQEFNCCGTVIELGGLTLGITIPYFLFILLELILLGCAVREKAKSDDAETEVDEESFENEHDDLVEKPCRCSSMANLVSWLVVANPFLGCLISWVLLYEVSSKKDALWVLGLEAGSVFLMFVTVYLERDHLTCCSLMLHAIPLVSDDQIQSVFSLLCIRPNAALTILRSSHLQ